MKSIIRNILINSFALYLASILFQGLIIEETITSIFVGGAVLSVMNLTVKPILSLVTLPLNFATMGGFSLLINAFLLYLLTILAPTIKIVDFTFKGAEVLGVIFPTVEFTLLTSIIAVSLLITAIKMGISWVIS